MTLREIQLRGKIQELEAEVARLKTENLILQQRLSQPTMPKENRPAPYSPPPATDDGWETFC